MVSLNFPILNTLKRFVLIVLMSLILFSCKKNNKEDLSDTTKTKVNTNKIVGRAFYIQLQMVKEKMKSYN